MRIYPAGTRRNRPNTPCIVCLANPAGVPHCTGSAGVHAAAGGGGGRRPGHPRSRPPAGAPQNGTGRRITSQSPPACDALCRVPAVLPVHGLVDRQSEHDKAISLLDEDWHFICVEHHRVATQSPIIYIYIYISIHTSTCATAGAVCGARGGGRGAAARLPGVRAEGAAGRLPGRRRGAGRRHAHPSRPCILPGLPTLHHTALTRAAGMYSIGSDDT
jgi:hypothetical protein